MGNAVTIQCRVIKTETGTVLFVGMELGSYSEEKL
jgi:hypothetical protein